MFGFVRKILLRRRVDPEGVAMELLGPCWYEQVLKQIDERVEEEQK